jgi:hypothetical protein
VLKCGTDTQPNQFTTKAVVAMADAIERDSSGAARIAIFPSSQLGTAESMASQLRSGALDFALISGANLGGIELLWAPQFLRIRNRRGRNSNVGTCDVASDITTVIGGNDEAGLHEKRTALLPRHNGGAITIQPDEHLQVICVSEERVYRPACSRRQA